MGRKASSKFINRELSWLEFNQRVLDEANDVESPLLERLKFLAITASNLDEFFMVRVGGLQQLAEQGNTKPDPAEMTAEEQLEAISQRTHQMLADQYACFLGSLEPALAEQGIKRLGAGSLSERQTQIVEQFFVDELFSILTPMAVSSVDDFPLLINQTLNVCVQLKPAPDAPRTPRFALIPFGRYTSRFVTLPSVGAGGYEYLLIEDVVAMYVDRFFPGEEIVECVPFRITRNADLSIREDLASDLLAEMQNVLTRRKQGDCVRIEIAERASPRMLQFLRKTFDLPEKDVYAAPGPIDLAAWMRLTELQGFDSLKIEPWPPKPSPLIPDGVKLFEVIARRDLLLAHPYESFDPVVRMIEEAADDPDVLAIKQILYRTAGNSRIVAALARASERRKNVTVIVELKARFDEARNIEQARMLEQAGVQVIYGIKGLKTHAKVCVIVRREPHGIQRYVHFGTGNYNENTARLYSDISYLTNNEELGADANSFFNTITGYSQPQRYRRIEAAPIGLRDRILEMITAETERQRQGQKAGITAKLNSLVDPAIIEALYEASKAGVPVRLNVRGICCLRPDIARVSQNITVVSIVDRFLEHSRILHFRHGGDDRVFISSADWMPRNLDKRIELLVPVEDPDCRKRLIGILETYFHDNVKARKLLSDGQYERVRPEKGKKSFRSQEVLYRRAQEAVELAEQARPTVFEPHRAPGSDT